MTVSVTYNNIAMTSAGKVHANSGTAGFVEMFYLTAPDLGSHTVQVTTTQNGYIEAGSVSFTGVNQTTSVRNIATAAGNSAAPSVTISSAFGDMVVDALVDGDFISSSGQTLRWLNNQENVDAGGNGAQSTAKGASSVPMSYTVTAGWWGIIGLDIVAAPGIQVSLRSDTLSDSRPSATSNHTIVFTTNTAIYGSSLSGSSTLALALDPAFTIPVGMDCGDVDVTTGSQFNFNYPSCYQTGTAWGFSATGSSITLVPPSDTAVHVATGTPITIKIGSNATVGRQGAHWITNPAAGGVYTISVGGTFGGSGNMLVAIRSGVTVQATVAESLSFTVSSVSASFPTTGILDNFNRADENPVANGHWAGPIESGYDPLTISTNQLTAPSILADSYWSAASFGPNTEAFATIATKPGNGACIALTCKIANPNTSSLNGYWAEFCDQSGTDTWDIYRIDNGSFTNLGASGSNVELSAGDSIGLECKSGSQKFKRLNGGTTLDAIPVQLLLAEVPRYIFRGTTVGRHPSGRGAAVLRAVQAASAEDRT